MLQESVTALLVKEYKEITPLNFFLMHIYGLEELMGRADSAVLSTCYLLLKAVLVPITRCLSVVKC